MWASPALRTSEVWDCVATPTGFEGVETQPNADDQRANLLNTLREVSPSLRFDYPELHDAALSCLQRISHAISRGDHTVAAAEVAAMLDALGTTCTTENASAQEGQ